MSTIKVNTINAATSGQAVAVDISNPKSFRNLFINGAMEVAQRGTSSTGDGYHTVDRFKHTYGGENEAPTFAQHALTSSDTGPWEKGFRNSMHITNGNQTGGAGASDYISLRQKVEATDLACCGWNHTSTSSYITLSFWVKASVAQTYFGLLQTTAGTGQNYPFSFAVSANTWTYVTKKIPGNSNVQIDNSNSTGLDIRWVPFYGTALTNNSSVVDTWVATSTAAETPDNTSTWWTTNDATFEITGTQLEVGEYATEFEHRTYAEELIRCHRYFYKPVISNYYYPAFQYHNQYKQIVVPFKQTMRATPTCTATYSGGGSFAQYENTSDHFKSYVASNHDAAAAFYLTAFEASAEL